jgi:mycothiol synthase
MTEVPLRRVVGALDFPVRAQATDLAARVKQYDGVEAISEAPLLALANGDPSVTHILAWRDDRLVGYAQGDAGAGSAELAVDPAYRRLGWATALVGLLAEASPGIRLWAHGDLGSARAVADSLGLIAVRELWEMTSERGGRRPAATDPEPAAGPSSAARFVFREFAVRHDREAWVELNAAAFAGHPEQGRLTVEDLDQRVALTWFDPAGLILAELDGLAGYVWTKIEGGVGEIYAIGVRPGAQGQRLGTRLLSLGLRHLEEQGVTEVRLFVEADNAPAIASYRRQGFTVTRRDVQYAFEA